jgi:hypothetical protein
VDEAAAALAGGAEVIDVKEPRHGPLGRADSATTAAIVSHVRGRRPVSAALGELLSLFPARGGGEENAIDLLPVPCGLSFVKWGLAGYRDSGRDWRRDLDRAEEALARRSPATRLVPVAYADWQPAGAPPFHDVCSHAVSRRTGVLLVDTFAKRLTGSAGQPVTLLDHVSQREMVALCRRCRSAGVRVALAGSLSAGQIEQLLPAEPDWFAVRTAACAGGRDGTVSVERVRGLRQLLQGPTRARRED